MRGLAAVTAGLAIWVAISGRVPSARIPRPRLPGPRQLIAALYWGGPAFVAGVAVSGLLAVSGVVAVVVALGRLAAQQLSDERVARRMADAWPDFIAILRSQLATGQPLAEATVEAAFRADGALRPFGMRLEESLHRGDPFRLAIEREKMLLANAVADRVLVSLQFCSDTGGGRVADILGALGKSVGDELRVRRSHDAALTQQRLTAAVALGAPWGLLLLTVTTNPQAADAYGTVRGMRIVLLGLGLTLLGYLLAQRSARLSRPRRVLR